MIGTLAAQAALAELAGGHRVGRQGFLSADRAARGPAQSRAGRPRRGGGDLGRRVATRPSGWACRRARWWTTWRWSATAPTTCPASRASATRARGNCSRSTATSKPSCAHAAEVTDKRAREALLEQAEQARLSRELVTIRRDVPVALRPGRAGAARAGSRGAGARCWRSSSSTAWRGGWGWAARARGARGRAAQPRRTRLPRLPASPPTDALRVTIVDDASALPALVGAPPPGPARGARHRNQFARAARRGTHRALARRERHRGLVSPLRPSPARRRPRRAGAGAAICRRSTDPACAPLAELLRDAAACRRPGRTSSTTGRCSGARASSWRAWRTTRCWRASSSIPAAARTPSTR